jgi:hypothetical protein
VMTAVLTMSFYHLIALMQHLSSQRDGRHWHRREAGWTGLMGVRKSQGPSSALSR